MSTLSPTKFLILLVLQDASEESCVCRTDIARKLRELMPHELRYIDPSEIQSALDDMQGWSCWITWRRPDIFSDEYEGRHYFLTEEGKAIARKAFARMSSLVAEGDGEPVYFPALDP